MPQKVEKTEPPKLSKNDLPTNSEQVGYISVNHIDFSSIYLFDEFVEEKLSKLNLPFNAGAVNYIEKLLKNDLYSEHRWGSPIPTKLEDITKHEKFLWMDLYKNLRADLKSELKRLRKFKIETQVPEKKISWNSLELGMFSFDRAAVGLHKTLDKNGNEIMTTSKEDVFAYIKHENKSVRAVKIFILSGSNITVSGQQLLYVGVGAAILVEELEKRGVKVEVNVIVDSQENNTICAGIIKVKKFESTLRLNDLLVVASSPRYYRYKGYRGFVAMFDHFNKRITDGLGSQPKNQTYINYFNKIYAKPFQPFIFFGNTYSREAAVKEVISILEKIEDNSIFKQHD